MIPVKTAAGQQVLKDRSIPLTQRQRAALILVDGKRSLAEVLQATSAAGVSRTDLERLFELGLLAPAPSAATEPAQPAGAPAQGAPTPQQRYAAAYPIAARLTSGLGLRGVRLNLAVEAATCYEELVAVAARIREAVGSEQYAPLRAALGTR
jgi:hypothetical protein